MMNGLDPTEFHQSAIPTENIRNIEEQYIIYILLIENTIFNDLILGLFSKAPNWLNYSTCKCISVLEYAAFVMPNFNNYKLSVDHTTN